MALCFEVVLARSPTPDNVDLTLTPRPAQTTLGALEPASAGIYEYSYRVAGGSWSVPAVGVSPATFQVQATLGDVVDARVRACESAGTLCSAWSVIASTSAGRLVPYINNNGKINEYQTPIVFGGDACDPVWTGAYCITHPMITGNPVCSGSSGVNPNASSEYIIRDAAGFARINTGSETVYGVCPGDYSTGSLAVTRQGASDTDGGLVKIVFYDDAAFDPQRSADDRRIAGDSIARIPRLRYEAASTGNLYWGGLTLMRDTVTANSAIYMASGPSTNRQDIYYDRMDVVCENYNDPQCTQNRGADGITFQNGALGDCVMRKLNNNSGWWVHETSSNVRFVGNVAYDCSNIVQTGSNVVNGTGEGMIVEDNDLQYTAARYHTEGSSSYWDKYASDGVIPESDTAFSASGEYVCADGVATFRHGSASALNPAVYKDNRVWGMRSSNNTGCAMFDAERGHAIKLLVRPSNTSIYNNVVIGGDEQLSLAACGGVAGCDGSTYQDIRVWNNFFYNLEEWPNQYSPPVGRMVSTNLPGGSDVKMAYNWFGPAGLSSDFSAGNSQIDYSCNNFKDSGLLANTTATGQDNTAIETNPGTVTLPSQLTNPLTVAYIAVDYDDFVVTRQFVGGATDTVTLSDVLPRTSSAASGRCSLATWP